jgi:hypothetical protein
MRCASSGALSSATSLRRVREWAAGEGWEVTEKVHAVTDGRLGTYDVSLLIIQLPKYAVFLEPVARDVMGAQGRVDLYAYPSLDRVMLLHKNGEWVIRPELGPTWPLPWGRETFVDLVRRLVEDR